MPSLNKVTLIGHLGRDPEIRKNKGGSSIANLTVATSENWKDKKTGDKQERTEWHHVVVFTEHTADFLEKYAKKGSLVYVEGQLQTRKWQDKDGSDRYSTEVVVSGYNGQVLLMDGKSGKSSAPSQQQYAPQTDLDDDMPF